MSKSHLHDLHCLQEVAGQLVCSKEAAPGEKNIQVKGKSIYFGGDLVGEITGSRGPVQYGRPPDFAIFVRGSGSDPHRTFPTYYAYFSDLVRSIKDGDWNKELSLPETARGKSAGG